MPPTLRRQLVRTFAPLVLILLLAQPARGEVDGGAPGGDAAAVTESGGLDTSVAPPAPPELVTPPELSSASLTKSEPTLVGNPAKADTEPPRPITRKLWFWIAVSCAIVVATGAIMAVQNPSTTRPDCPSGYVCPR